MNSGIQSWIYIEISMKVLEIKSYMYDTIGDRSWKIPYDLSSSDHYRIKLSCMQDTSASCFSEEFSITTTVYRLKFTARSDSTVYAWGGFFFFTHVSASYTFTSPAAGSTFTGVCKVAWQSNGPVGTRVNIYLLNDTVMQKGGYYGYSYTGNSGKYDIRIPVTTPQGDRFRIKLTATNDTTIQSFSDYFTIIPVAKTISVTYPPADTVLMGGKSTYITCTHTGVADGYSQNYAFKIDLYDSTTFVSSLFQIVEYTVQACYWVVPKTVATKSTYRVKITSLLFPDVFSFSGYFTIAN
jgi:hypothetical protein